MLNAENLRNQGYGKAAFYAQDYVRYNLPHITEEPLSLPSDSWNSGSNHRIDIPAGSRVRLITREEAFRNGLYGVECDRVMGLWVSDFQYNYHHED